MKISSACTSTFSYIIEYKLPTMKSFLIFAVLWTKKRMLHKKFIKKITIKQRIFFMFSLNSVLPLEENLFPFSLFHILFFSGWCYFFRAHENEQIPTIPSMQSESLKVWKRRLLSIYILIIYYFLLRSLGMNTGYMLKRLRELYSCTGMLGIIVFGYSEGHLKGLHFCSAWKGINLRYKMGKPFNEIDKNFVHLFQ